MEARPTPKGSARPPRGRRRRSTLTDMIRLGRRHSPAAPRQRATTRVLSAGEGPGDPLSLMQPTGSFVAGAASARRRTRDATGASAGKSAWMGLVSRVETLHTVSEPSQEDFLVSRVDAIDSCSEDEAKARPSTKAHQSMADVQAEPNRVAGQKAAKGEAKRTSRRKLRRDRGGTQWVDRTQKRIAKEALKSMGIL